MTEKNIMVFLVGRSKECDGVIADPTVSRRHAEFVVNSERDLMLVDCDSKFGTFVQNGSEWRRIASAQVQLDDLVRLGQYETSIRNVMTDVVERLRRVAPPTKAPPTQSAPIPQATTTPPDRTIVERNPDTGEIITRKDR